MFEKTNMDKTLTSAGALAGLGLALVQRKKMGMTALFLLGGALLGASIGVALKKS